MREVEQIPVIEVASILGISEHNVKIRSHRARNMLRKILTPKLPQLNILEFHADRCTRVARAVMQELRSGTETVA
jgi:RNA polymerase sigma-70 factor (ECF subfamily)